MNDAVSPGRLSATSQRITVIGQCKWDTWCALRTIFCESPFNMCLVYKIYWREEFSTVEIMYRLAVVSQARVTRLAN